MRGMVDPPNTNMVNKTMMSVVVTITCRFSSLNSRWSANAYAMAPRSPEMYVMN